MPMQRDPRSTPAYGELEASELFCPTCRRAQRVRQRLLIVLPTGNKYEYRCETCGSSVGEKMDDDASQFSLLLPR